ncbi:undecaprenyl-diphosphatase [Brucella intermedia]|uniref:undecaprenyl-diphosphatase n=1 Tax=Brucella intermedia TaxID=94625 RepID=UPI00235F4CF7|nr:undecaprenyl-diphosphatase [Brucella intermedia]
MPSFDTNLFLYLNAGASPNAIVAGLAIFITRYLQFLVPVYLIALWLRNTNKSRQTVTSIALALLIAVVLNYLIGMIWFRPRPFMAGLGHTLMTHRPNSSFPSKHGITFACCAAVLFMVGRMAAGWVAVGCGIVMAWSRIYIGVHYPLDMVGSVIVVVVSRTAPVRTGGATMMSSYLAPVVVGKGTNSRYL